MFFLPSRPVDRSMPVSQSFAWHTRVYMYNQRVKVGTPTRSRGSRSHGSQDCRDFARTQPEQPVERSVGALDGIKTRSWLSALSVEPAYRPHKNVCTYQYNILSRS